MMKIGLFDPYLDTLGGGERYILTLAEYCLAKGHCVEIFWPEKETLEKASARFNLKFAGLQYNTQLYRLFSKANGFWQKQKLTKSYDLIIHLSDGSLPFLFAKKNIIHFQVPFTQASQTIWRSSLNKIKLRRINEIVCNSFFTKKFIDQEFGVQSQVVYPPVAIRQFLPGKKEKIILSVGRFDSPLHAKKQSVLLDVFKKMRRAGLKNWQLVLVGGSRRDDNVKELKKKAKRQPIKILTNVDFKTLQDLYAKARIYWHAAGFGINEEKNPEKVEHFGMTTVEAMAAGCVPVVCAKGGQKEIVDQAINGFLWQKKKDLLRYTQELISNEKLYQRMSQRARQKSKQFSKKVFCQQFEKLIK